MNGIGLRRDASQAEIFYGQSTVAARIGAPIPRGDAVAGCATSSGVPLEAAALRVTPAGRASVCHDDARSNCPA